VSQIDKNLFQKIPEKAVSFILNSTYFSFALIAFINKHGSPMGFPLSSIIADLVMKDLEEKVLERIGTQVLFYFRYVDDIIMAISFSFHDDILDIFNSFHSKLQFTM